MPPVIQAQILAWFKVPLAAGRLHGQAGSRFTFVGLPALSELGQGFRAKN